MVYHEPDRWPQVLLPLIVLGSPRKDLVGRRRGVFGSTVDRVMRNAPCRVMVTASRAGAPA